MTVQTPASPPVSGTTSDFILAADLAELQERRCMAVQVGGHTIALYYHDGKVYAVDNRCPHMGFPLDRGSVHGGILTCHWHHARFDLATGGAFDLWADDVRTYPVEVRDDSVWVDVAPLADPAAHQRDRLQVGLERDLSLVIGKSVLTLTEGDRSPVEPFRTGLEFGVRYRAMGWGQGLTMLVCFMNMIPSLHRDDRPRALYHGLSAVARDSAGSAPRFPVRPLPGATGDFSTLKRWFRQFIEVRDAEGAERCIISAVRNGATSAQMADILFSAVTDHRYISTGHPADFTNKAFEALDIAGWDLAESVLTSLVDGYAGAARMEESNAWRHPIDLVALLESTFERLPAALSAGAKRNGSNGNHPAGHATHSPELIATLLDDRPVDTVEAMLDALQTGTSPERLAAAVAYAAALRIARFHTSNEFGDWDTALHTFTFANAIHQGLRRSPSVELLRGVFDAAMSIYLDRFLNTPAARLPEPNGTVADPSVLLDDLTTLLDRQQQVNQAARHIAHYLYAGGEPAPLLARIGRLLLREDRDFHTIQAVEAAFRQHSQTQDPMTASHFLIAAGRYLAAHSPTVRAQGQTYQIALRLHQGDRIFEEA